MIGMESYREEIESFRVYHNGIFGKCPECGRAVFLPCLACETERHGTVNGPENTSRLENIKLGVQLFGNERKRYEKILKRKIKEKQMALSPPE